MNILFGYLSDHLKKDFRFDYYLSVLLFLSTGLFVNYYFQLESGYLDPLFGTWYHFFIVFGVFLFGYLGTLLIQFIFKLPLPLNDYKFWISLLFILSIAAHDLSFSWHIHIIDLIPYEYYYFAVRTLKNILSIFTVLIPVYAFHKLSNSETRYYGMTRVGFEPRPYIILSTIALVGIAISLYESGLSSYYPTYHESMGAPFGEREWIAVMIYEFAYGFDFISIELIFRGFLVIGLSKWLGKEAIMPMVAVYCFLHLGKPAAEAISSIFGGFLLGIFAYKSKSILGGVMVHISIALGMELFAYLLN